MAATKEGEAADIQHYLDHEKISDEAQYDGFTPYARIFWMMQWVRF